MEKQKSIWKGPKMKELLRGLRVITLTMPLVGLGSFRVLAADSGKTFDAKAEKDSDSAQYKLLEDKDSAPELKPSVARYEKEKDIDADDKYILGGEDEGKRVAQKPAESNP